MSAPSGSPPNRRENRGGRSRRGPAGDKGGRPRPPARQGKPPPPQNRRPPGQRQGAKENRGALRHPPGKKRREPSLGRKILDFLSLRWLRPRGAGPPEKAGGKTARRPVRPSGPPPDLETITTSRLYIGNLAYAATEEDLLDVFQGIGKVKSVDVVYNNRTYRSLGRGFAEYMSVTDARRAAAELHGKSFMGRLLHLGPAKERGQDERESGDDPGPVEPGPPASPPRAGN